MPQKSRPRSRRALAAAGATVAALLWTAPAATAGKLIDSVTCAPAPAAQVFLPWLDPAQYQLAPGGAAESADGWSLGAGASVAAGNEPWSVSGPGESSLNLPAGSSATSSPMCVGAEHPTLRFFARSSSASALSSLRVEVLYEDASGAVLSLPVGSVGAAGTWAPSPVFAVAANLLALLPGDRTAVAFRFTPVGGATWRVDDVHVDPWGRG